MKIFFFVGMLCSYTLATAQVNEDSVMIARIFELALTKGKAYEDLYTLCKEAGPRLAGSKAAARSVEITELNMRRYQFDTVFRQEVVVPHWERGSATNLKVSKKGYRELPICALGGSVGGTVEGEVIEVLGWNDLSKLKPEEVKGKVVFFNRPMDPRMVHTFNAYGTCVDQRVYGAIWAASMGAKGIIVRSMNLRIDDYPHTGMMVYSDTVEKIPAVAISTKGAEELGELIKTHKGLKVTYSLNPKQYPDAISHNVVGQLNGKIHPNKYIAVGGHLDAWDLGEGAHDDGAGCIQSIETLRILKELGYEPRHSLRAVMFMNEENGLKGALEYARLVELNKEKHIAALEADRGAFAPRGFFIQGSPEQLQFVKQWLPLFEEYGIHVMKSGGAGADVGPLQNVDSEILLIGFIPDSQRYFDYHHASTDVFENVNQRELELGAAALTALIYLIDKYVD